MAKVKSLHQEVMEEVESFLSEYDSSDPEVVQDYLALLDDFSPMQKNLFLQALGY